MSGDVEALAEDDTAEKDALREARKVEELDGMKVWAHSVTPDGYEPNPYRVIPHRSTALPAEPTGEGTR